MRVLLVSANTETINMPALPMGLGLVAAATRKAGHSVTFLDLMGESAPEAALARAISRTAPEVIGISIRNVDDQVSDSPRFLLDAARSVVAQCKALSGAPVVLGGPGYSMFPQSALDFLGADMGIQGEGEAAFLSLLALLDSGGDVSIIPGLYRRGQGCKVPPCHGTDLDNWPYPEPDIFDGERFNDPACFLPYQTRRGCPLKCSYCATSAIEGTRIRKRSVDAVVENLARWRDAGCSRVFFVDNTFNLPPGYAKALCDRLISRDLRLSWRAIFYPGNTPASLIEAMARAGCTDVSLGFESGNDAVLRGFNKRFTAEDVRRTATMLRDAGIRSMGFLLLGGPHETRETVLESLEFVDALGLAAMKLTVGIRIYPYTPLAAQAVREGVIRPEDDLLRPRFYIKAGLENWLRQTVARWASHRPDWTA